MAESNVPNAQSLVCKVRQLSREIGLFVTRALSDYEINPSQADFLFHLMNSETQPSVIAGLIGIDRSQLSRMIRQFEEKDWLIREVDKENRSKVELTLTVKGRQIATEIDPHAAFVHSVFEEAMTPGEIEILSLALEKAGISLSKRDPSEWRKIV